MASYKFMQFTRREVHVCMNDIFHHLQPYTRIAVQPLLITQSHGFMYALMVALRIEREEIHKINTGV